MLVKLGKQIKVSTDDSFIVKYGTINALNPQSIFISLHSWAMPKHNLRFDKKLKKLALTVKTKIYEDVNYDVFHQKYIVDFDLRSSGLQKNKQSFLSVEITLYPKLVVAFPSESYNIPIKRLIESLVSDIKKDINFTFSSKKIK